VKHSRNENPPTNYVLQRVDLIIIIARKLLDGFQGLKKYLSFYSSSENTTGDILHIRSAINILKKFM
jgi:hypothetical protein